MEIILTEKQTLYILSSDARLLAAIALEVEDDVLKITIEHEGTAEVQERVPTL